MPERVGDLIGRMDFPDDESMRMSHEAIYQEIRHGGAPEASLALSRACDRGLIAARQRKGDRS